MYARVAFAALALAMGVAPAMAANVNRPYQNIDRRNDAGNDTGDSKVDALNRAQLDENYWPAHRPSAPAYGAPGMQAPQQPYYNR